MGTKIAEVMTEKPPSSDVVALSPEQDLDEALELMALAQVRQLPIVHDNQLIGMLDCTLAADVPFGDGERWVEVAPPGGGAALALVPPRGDYQTGRMTGVALESSDPRADHEELTAAGVDVELIGGDGTVPLLFFRDADGNQLMIVEGRFA